MTYDAEQQLRVTVHTRGSESLLQAQPSPSGCWHAPAVPATAALLTRRPRLVVLVLVFILLALQIHGLQPDTPTPLT
jgi:hypothetical protein